jgi:hypothetical protein
MPVEVIRPKKLEGGLNKAPFIPLREREGAVEEWIKQNRGEAVRAPSPRRLTMRVRMIRTRHGGVDGGTRVLKFDEGKVYATDGSADGYIDEPLALAFLRCGHAIEDKMMVAAPETKAAMPEPTHIDIAWQPEPPVTKPHKAQKKGRR